ncbi:hypothetical protein [Deinococcus puniceus]|uniref:Uncharacterized protein n=1 Tax=Deinococcus puniceus TaxID=1182568 RepID=A0A172TAS0_9DEIO|nr:hypothetical protein [Deinococcus puniceus]ANE44135.1 hypothetical protein SU48_10535 [Deinococcus puniceus]
MAEDRSSDFSDFQSPLSERDENRARLKASIDALTEQASLQVNLQKEPLKMLGGASAVGAVLGMVVGRQFRRSKKIYVDAASPVKHQKALMKVQKGQKSKGGIGSALIATLSTLAVKTLTDKVITPRLEGMANSMLDRAGQPVSKPAAKPGAPKADAGHADAAAEGLKSALSKLGLGKSDSAEAKAERATPLLRTPAPATRTSAVPTSSVAPVSTGGVASFIKSHPGQVAAPESKVEAKAQGSVITETEKANPNL